MITIKQCAGGWMIARQIVAADGIKQMYWNDGDHWADTGKLWTDLEAMWAVIRRLLATETTIKKERGDGSS